MILKQKHLKSLPLDLMILPGLILVFIFHYIPMGGILIAFEKFLPSKGLFNSEWIGLDNFRYMANLPNTFQVIWNTIFISLLKIVAGRFVPITIALLLNEVGCSLIKRSVQTIVYLPHFLSWVILGGVLIDILSPSSGLVNQIIGGLGFKEIFFLGDKNWFPYTLALTHIWKEAGFGTIVYLAAITSIDVTQYESAVIDGAGRLRQAWYITLPGMLPIIILTSVLSLGSILDGGFDQVFNLYSPMVYSTGDILGTFVYRLGLIDFQFGVATAIGLFQSGVSFLLISLSYFLAYKLANYRIF